jgi:hypothetical protein
VDVTIFLFPVLPRRNPIGLSTIPSAMHGSDSDDSVAAEAFVFESKRSTVWTADFLAFRHLFVSYVPLGWALGSSGLRRTTWRYSGPDQTRLN